MYFRCACGWLKPTVWFGIYPPECGCYQHAPPLWPGPFGWTITSNNTPR